MDHRSKLELLFSPTQIHHPQNRTSEQSSDVCARIWSLGDKGLILEGMSRNLGVRAEEVP